MTERGLQVHEWRETGYQPLVFAAGWQVALLNWEPLFDLANAGEIERHNGTDEVFILTQGRAVIFTIDEQGMQVEEMLPGVLYNVRQGVWHNLLSTRDATWVIVEDRDTHLHDCEYRRLSPPELAHLMSNLPAWIS